MERLYDGIRIDLWRINTAGGYKISKIEYFTNKIILELSGGQPFNTAYNEAERLAILLDAELVLDGIMIRKSRKGDYK